MFSIFAGRLRWEILAALAGEPGENATTRSDRADGTGVTPRGAEGPRRKPQAPRRARIAATVRRREKKPPVTVGAPRALPDWVPDQDLNGHESVGN
jgi:hypothetical protein